MASLLPTLQRGHCRKGLLVQKGASPSPSPHSCQRLLAPIAQTRKLSPGEGGSTATRTEPRLCGQRRTQFPVHSLLKPPPQRGPTAQLHPRTCSLGELPGLTAPRRRPEAAAEPAPGALCPWSRLPSPCTPPAPRPQQSWGVPLSGRCTGRAGRARPRTPPQSVSGAGAGGAGRGYRFKNPAWAKL